MAGKVGSTRRRRRDDDAVGEAIETTRSGRVLAPLDRALAFGRAGAAIRQRCRQRVTIRVNEMRLDEDKLEALRSWGERLSQGGGEEAAAVGRAILMLAEEIDRLHIELWHARLQEGGAESVATDATIEEDEAPVASSLHVRLQRVLRRDSGPSTTQPEETTASDAESERTTTAQDWIDALRRQK